MNSSTLNEYFTVLTTKLCKFWLYWVTFEHYAQINTVKCDADQEIRHTTENLQTVGSEFFTDMLIFIYIWSS